jgi:hypothetical protein
VTGKAGLPITSVPVNIMLTVAVDDKWTAPVTSIPLLSFKPAVVSIIFAIFDEIFAAVQRPARTEVMLVPVSTNIAIPEAELVCAELHFVLKSEKPPNPPED